MGKYDDIINMKWPVPSKRPRMDMESRAKIFLPFSALKGLGNAIDEQNKTNDTINYNTIKERSVLKNYISYKKSGSEENTMKENKMGTMPVNKLLINMALPMMISMLVQALYNIVDSIFVARISEEALTAVSMAFPMQNLMIGVAGGVGVGTNALLSRALGEGRHAPVLFLKIVCCKLILLFEHFNEIRYRISFTRCLIFKFNT